MYLHFLWMGFIIGKLFMGNIILLKLSLCGVSFVLTSINLTMRNAGVEGPGFHFSK